MCSSAESTEDRQVVQQRPLRVARLARVELDERAADLDARRAGGLARRGSRARAYFVGRLLGRVRPERDVIEVVVDLGRRLDEARAASPRATSKYASALARPLDLRAVELARARRRGSSTRSATCFERPALARALGLEQRQLPAPRVRADERELRRSGRSRAS